MLTRRLEQLEQLEQLDSALSLVLHCNPGTFYRDSTDRSGAGDRSLASLRMAIWTEKLMARRLRAGNMYLFRLWGL